jgi:four helix bundle protein
MKTYDLEERLTNFSVSIIGLTQKIPMTYVGNYMSNQITRSGISCSLNYGEAQAAESYKDFVHKMKICLKEMRETMIAINIITNAHICQASHTTHVKTELNELISIFVTSIKTAKSKMK